MIGNEETIKAADTCHTTRSSSTAPSVAPIIEDLENLFESFNRKFFNSALLVPVITLSQKGTKSAKGWCTGKKYGHKQGVILMRIDSTKLTFARSI